LNLGGDFEIWKARSDYEERRGEERKGESNKIAINTVEDEKDPELKEGGRDNEERRNVGRKKREPKQ